jgi:hypothetical protein
MTELRSLMRVDDRLSSLSMLAVDYVGRAILIEEGLAVPFVCSGTRCPKIPT